VFSITSAQPLSQGAEKESIRLFKRYVSQCKLCGKHITISRYVLSVVDNIRVHVVPPIAGNIISSCRVPTCRQHYSSCPLTCRQHYSSCCVPPVGNIIAHVVHSLVGNIIAHVVPSLVGNITAHVPSLVGNIIARVVSPLVGNIIAHVVSPLEATL
jgi:hypothetical protein